jgi:hypothetical protein
LKLRTVSGVATLSVRHPDLGSFAIREDWTDWSVANTTPMSQSLMIDAFGLAELAEIVESLSRGTPSKNGHTRAWLLPVDWRLRLARCGC